MKLKKLIERIEEQQGRERRIDPFRDRLSVSLESSETGRSIPERGFQTEHAMVLRIGITFWANQAEHYEARRNAESALQDFLYRDVVGQLTQIRSMLDSADRHTLQLAITELIGSLRP